jgi:hypothetical protein
MVVFLNMLNATSPATESARVSCFCNHSFCSNDQGEPPRYGESRSTELLAVGSSALLEPGFGTYWFMFLVFRCSFLCAFIFITPFPLGEREKPVPYSIPE